MVNGSNNLVITVVLNLVLKVETYDNDSSKCKASGLRLNQPERMLIDVGYLVKLLMLL